MGDLASERYRIRKEYPVAPIFKIERLRAIAVRTRSREREVVLKPADCSRRTGTLVGSYPDEFSRFEMRGGIEFDDPQSERAVDVEMQKARRGRRYFGVYGIRVVGIAVHVGIGLRIGPKGAVPTGIVTNHADSRFPRVRVVVEKSGRVRHGTRRTYAEIIGVEIPVYAGKNRRHGNGKEFPLGIGKLPGKRQSGTGVHSHRIHVRAGKKRRIVGRIVETEGDSREGNSFAIQCSFRYLRDGCDRFRRTSANGAGKGDRRRTSPSGPEFAAVRIKRCRPAECDVRLGGKVSCHLGVVSLKREVFKKHFRLR